MIKSFSEVNYNYGNAIFEQGGVSERMFLILEGEVELKRKLNEKKGH